jgi:hypothetical protein
MDGPGREPDDDPAEERSPAQEEQRHEEARQGDEAELLEEQGDHETEHRP